MGRAAIASILLLILVGATSIGSCRRLGIWLAKEEVPPHADAMILLMGNFPERVLQAVDIYNEGVSDSLIIVHESMGPYKTLEARGANVIRPTDQACSAAVALGIPDSCIIILPGEARSTLDEAQAVRNYLADKPRIDTLILVSSPAHMRRAHLIFKTVLRKSGVNAYIGCSPSAYSAYNPKKWWRRKEDLQSVLSEWVKIISFIFFEKGKSVNN
jgi:uncharacterized SAM-binding protein YcdF (DUF218 family)